MRDVPECGKKLIQSFEECILRVYDDKQPKVIITDKSQVKGRLTSGWGHTGKDVVIGMTVDQTLADKNFDRDLIVKVEVPIDHKIGAVADELTDNQYGALCSFVFNLGVGDPKKPEWTIWKRLRAKQFDQIPQEMAKFVNWEGQKSLGLVRRRTAEQLLWSTEEPGTVDNNPPSSATRVEPTPPTPADPVPAARSGTIIATAGAAVAGAGPMIHQAIEGVQPYADMSDTVKHMLSALAIVAAGLAVLSVGFVVLEKRLNRN